MEEVIGQLRTIYVVGDLVTDRRYYKTLETAQRNARSYLLDYPDAPLREVQAITINGETWVLSDAPIRVRGDNPNEERIIDLRLEAAALHKRHEKMLKKLRELEGAP